MKHGVIKGMAFSTSSQGSVKSMDENVISQCKPAYGKFVSGVDERI